MFLPPEKYQPDSAPRLVSALVNQLKDDTVFEPPHAHSRAQLVFGLKGTVTCEVANGIWMLPPQCALWIPGGIEHSVRGESGIEVYVIFIDAAMTSALPQKCCTVSVSPLFRELIVAVAKLPTHYDVDGSAGRLVQTMIDQLAAAPVERLYIPLPSDPRLRRIADGLLSNPADKATISEWAKRIGMSERTLFRLVPLETGMNFGRWRQQFSIMTAIQRLTKGDTVQTIAFDLGYESPSAFIAMFKRALGAPPIRYLAHRRQEADIGDRDRIELR